jgi:hypothetical protein
MNDHGFTAVERPVHRGLVNLASVELSPPNQRRYEHAMRGCAGSPIYRRRKLVEARSLFQLSELAPAGRLVITTCDLTSTLRVSMKLKVPVPHLDESGEFRVLHAAWIGLSYPEAALSQALPGYAFINLLLPSRVWSANVGMDLPGQPLCLGASMPVGIPCVELVLAAYGALSMQSVMIDERDAAGVLNPGAARWWQQNMHRVPLTRRPFLQPDEPAPREISS